jgi:hypothetical protein
LASAAAPGLVSRARAISGPRSPRPRARRDLRRPHGHSVHVHVPLPRVPRPGRQPRRPSPVPTSTRPPPQPAPPASSPVHVVFRILAGGRRSLPVPDAIVSVAASFNRRAVRPLVSALGVLTRLACPLVLDRGTVDRVGGARPRRLSPAGWTTSTGEWVSRSHYRTTAHSTMASSSSASKIAAPKPHTRCMRVFLFRCSLSFASLSFPPLPRSRLPPTTAKKAMWGQCRNRAGWCMQPCSAAAQSQVGCAGARAGYHRAGPFAAVPRRRHV